MALGSLFPLSTTSTTSGGRDRCCLFPCSLPSLSGFVVLSAASSFLEVTAWNCCDFDAGFPATSLLIDLSLCLDLLFLSSLVLLLDSRLISGASLPRNGADDEDFALRAVTERTGRACSDVLEDGCRLELRVRGLLSSSCSAEASTAAGNDRLCLCCCLCFELGSSFGF